MMTPGSANALLLADAGYQIQRSVRLRSSASASFSRTPAASNRLVWTKSFWMKRGALTSSAIQSIFCAKSDDSNYTWMFFDASLDTLYIRNVTAGNATANWITTQVFRDPSAWYHCVLTWDSTQATQTNRLKFYVNGTQVTSWSASSGPALNENSLWNAATSHAVGNYPAFSRYFDGYLTDINFIDGQALTPASFGEINPVTGVWSAKKYAGTYGTNGFFLNFSDNSAATAAAIGKDTSGNGNNWTPSGVSVTAGVTYDSMLDVPLGAGGAERGNYATLNPLTAATITYSNGNLTVASSSTTWQSAVSTIGMASGKWYCEITVIAVGSNDILMGLTSNHIGMSYPGSTSTSFGYIRANGNKYNNAIATAYGSAYGVNDVIGIAFDADTGTLAYYKNGVSQGTAFTSLTNGPYYFATSSNDGSSVAANFGQRPFAYTPPTGFKALHTGNLPEPVIKKPNAWMDVSLWTGNNTSQSVVNSGAMQPDLVWVKGRNNAAWGNFLQDTTRGIVNFLKSDSTGAEATTSPAIVSAVNVNGFTVLANGNSNNLNDTYVAWQWKANGAAVSNTAGSITSQVSAGVSQGFSVVTYTGTGANATVGHGLGVAPKMVIVKARGLVTGWYTYHASLANSQFVALNTTQAVTAGGDVWNSTSPTSSVFSLGTNGNVNQAGTLVAYCFSEVAGYSKFGSYTGNGSADGPFVFCGFRPRFVMVKRTDSTGNWYLIDTARSASNLAANVLAPNLSAAEPAFTTEFNEDILSNGFKLRVANVESNANGGTYIFMAFAEHPFKNSLAR